MFFTIHIQAQEVNDKDINLYDEFKKIQVEKEEYFSTFHKDSLKGTGYKPYKRWEYFYEPRLSAGNFRNPADIYRDYQTLIESKKEATLQRFSASWQEVGPINVHTQGESGAGIGRVNCIEIHPNDNNTIWIGAAAGGAWKSTNKGKTWECADFSSFLSMSVSDIKISKSNPNVMYIATGDDDGVGGNGIYGYTIGLIKSTDAGKTWNITGIEKEISDRFIISSIYIYPDDSEKLLISTTRGIYRSLDGGQEWDLVSPTNEYYRNITPVLGTEGTLLVSTYLKSVGNNAKIYRSEDWGETWKEVWSDPNALRIRMSTTVADENLIYMIAANRSYGMLGVYKSTDKGRNWKLAYNDKYLLSSYPKAKYPGTQGYYNLAIAVSPLNPNLVTVGGVNIWHSTDGAKTFKVNSTWWYDKRYAYVHADQHFLVYNDKGELFNSNDGGVYMNDNNVDKNSWIDLTNGLSVGQFYKISVANSKDLMVLTGAQDNGSDLLYEGKWRGVGGGDGMDNAINQNDRRIFYWSSQGGNFSYTKNGLSSSARLLDASSVGEKGAWVTPIMLDPRNNDIVYIGYHNVWSSKNQGESGWEKLGTMPTASIESRLTSLGVGYSNNKRILYASTKGALMRKVGSEDWKTVYSSPVTITSITPDLKDGMSVWITLSGFAEGMKVIYLTPGQNGLEPHNYSEGIPNIPVNDLLIMEDNNTYFCGTDIGVFVKESKKQAWVLFGQGMPSLIVNELEYNKKSHTLIAATYGRGLWQTKINNCSIEKPIVSYEGDLTFCKGDSITFTLENANQYDKLYWSTDETSESITVHNSASVFVTVEDGNECLDGSDIFSTKMLDFKDIRVTSSSKTYAFCDNEDSLKLTANGGYSKYLWSTGETKRKIYIKEPGNYWVECIAKNGCTGRLEFEILESFTHDKPSIKKEGDELVCTITADSYIWMKNGRILSGENSQRLIPEKDGAYSVIALSPVGCQSEESDEFDITIGINDNHSDISFLNIYPNPNDGFIMIDLSLKGTFNSEIFIVDLNGNTVYEEKNLIFTNTVNRRLDISNLATGIYFMRINIGTNSYVKKIIRK